MSKGSQAFRTIREVADWLGVAAHVLRFWESKFPQIKPVKRAGGRRYYRPADMELIGGIKVLLHDQGYTIRGVQKLIRADGIAAVSAMSPPLEPESVEADTAENLAWEADTAAEAVAPDTAPETAPEPEEALQDALPFDAPAEESVPEPEMPVAPPMAEPAASAPAAATATTSQSLERLSALTAAAVSPQDAGANPALGQALSALRALAERMRTQVDA